MNILQTIREVFGSDQSNTIIEDENGVALTEQQLSDRRKESLEDIVEKAENSLEELTIQFDQDDQALDLQIQACDVYLQKAKGDQDVEFNKTIYKEKKTKILDRYLENIQTINNSVEKAKIELNEIEKGGIGSGRKKIKDHREYVHGEHELQISSSYGDGVYRSKDLALASHRAIIKQNTAKGGSDVIKLNDGRYLVSSNRRTSIFEKQGSGKRLTATELYSKAENDLDLEKGETDKFENHYVAVVAKDLKGRVLLLKRKDNGEWMLPGGHIDAGEFPIEAAVREFKEETNLDLNLDSCYGCGEKQVQDNKMIYYFQCYNPQGLIANIDDQDEASDIRYMSTDEWLQKDLFKDTKEHLSKLLIPQGFISKAEGQREGYENELLKAIEIVEQAYSEGFIAEDEYQTLFEKGRKQAGHGDKRNWNGVEYTKGEKGWKPEKGKIIHSSEQLSAHAQVTSDVQLRKVAKDKDQHPTLRDSARHELTGRTKKDKSEKWGDILTQIENKAKKEKLGVKDLIAQLRADLEDDEDEGNKNNNVLSKQQ